MDRPTKITVIEKNDGYEIICMDEMSGSSIGVDLPINGYKALAEHFRTGAMEISSDELGNCNKPHVNGWLSFPEHSKEFNDLIKKEGDCLVKFDDGTILRFSEEFPLAVVTHFKPF